MKNKGLGLFERYLSIWVVLCIFAGILIGKIFPSVPNFLGKAEYANVSIPIAILIWLMIIAKYKNPTPMYYSARKKKKKFCHFVHFLEEREKTREVN